MALRGRFHREGPSDDGLTTKFQLHSRNYELRKNAVGECFANVFDDLTTKFQLRSRNYEIGITKFPWYLERRKLKGFGRK